MSSNTVHAESLHPKRKMGTGKVWKPGKTSIYFYIMLAVPLLHYLIFKLLPMAGLLIAFRKYMPSGKIYGEFWVGFRYFEQFIVNPTFWRALKNNLILSLMNLVLTFPFPIIFALLLNEVRNGFFKKVTQTVSYLPRFLSMVVVAGLVKEILSPSSGIVNHALVYLGMEKIFFLNEPGWFRSIYIISDIWQWTGWSAIIYLAALAGIDQQQYESAMIDGAGRWKQTIHITLPGILPTIIITLILKIGHILDIGFEKILLLSNPMTYETADVISTFVYRMGIQEGNFSFATAIGFSESVVALVLITGANWIARKTNDTSLW